MYDEQCRGKRKGSSPGSFSLSLSPPLVERVPSAAAAAAAADDLVRGRAEGGASLDWLAMSV